MAHVIDEPLLRETSVNHVSGQPSGLNPLPAWKPYQLILFRIAFIFFIAISIPNTGAWYQQLIELNWLKLNYRDLYDIARFGSGINFLGNSIFGSTLLGYANWITTLLVATAGGLVWTAIVYLRRKPRTEYYNAWYWLRVVVRYRAGIGIIGFGFTKLLPVQMPYPSLGILNTNFGDLTAQKIYWLSIGIVPWYQVFAGVVEVAAGTLLFFRKTTTLGAILLLGALGDIVYVNFAYDGGVHVYSSYFVLLAALLLVNDIPKVWKLLVGEQDVTPVNYYPDLSGSWLKYARVGLKSLTLFLFLGVLFYLQLINFLYDPYKQPSVAGVKTLRGNYAVTTFRLNGVTIPYSPLDSVRWQEVTFENWSTLTFRVNKPHPLDLSNGGGDPQRDVNRTFELTGLAGGQRAFHYYADEVNKVLYLEDKFKPVPDRRNRTAGVGGDGGASADEAAEKAAARETAIQKQDWIPAAARKNIGDEVYKIDPLAYSARRTREYAKAPVGEIRKRFIVKYETTDGSHVILTGEDENKNSLYVVLDRVEKPYALSPSQLQAGKY
ncbi:hypothetical protein SAMN05660909_04143 [Chitinophaga terrae (ex Kim and Jung 2007)]|uniref:DoxX family protein n=1 Tax=Chitinophaga terrae (ex Kim and Jung 2007) TaxID=408074 RepID=A0A1H4F4M7_9BACT|nr:hypothetical protein [Chitinophaga terrae (ex Kim and Jung 2007)]GEP92024.1 hypothetical protein CTE07_36690 [Chitinophaga terrae (ex Kim and Jung 2007)]SEA91910.1 hypothetical protein SAMN05660909_04143 [Chitinophaga terrae (ex Kim and Jung 2007)]